MLYVDVGVFLNHFHSPPATEMTSMAITISFPHDDEPARAMAFRF